jgi:hypothetical protein
MSMLNRRTQPLDPAVLQSLTQQQPAPARLTAPLSPLKQPEALLDSLAPTSARRTDMPAQSSSITGALTALPPLPAATPDLTPATTTAETAAPALNARLSENEAELLLDVSSKLADARQQNPANFTLIMEALQLLNTDASGSVDFSGLSAPQQQALAGLGMTPQNTKVIFQQLYHLLLPESQQETSQAFKKVQAHVTSFISNLDLRERAASQINLQYRDLSEIRGVVTTLSANSIDDLLKDQTNSVFDLSVGRINSQNFNIRSAMDYTIGHMVVLSQQEPQTLQQVDGLIKKVKDKQTLDVGEQALLKRFGLDLNSENNLQTLDGKALDTQAMGQLENVIFSMSDPSEGYSRVLKASAAVITQSRKLEDITAFAKEQVKEVQQTTVAVVQGSQQLEQIRTDANQIDARLKFAQFKAEHLADAMDSATGLFGQLNLDPQLLGQFQIQIIKEPQGLRFMVAGKEVPRLEMLARLGQLLAQQKAEISGMANQLARKKTEALTTTAQLNVTTEKLETQKTELKATEQLIVAETAVLKQLEAEREQIVAQAAPGLKPEEKLMVETQITPAVEHQVAQAVEAADAVVQEIEVTVAKAESAIIRSHAIQAAVASDAEGWETRIADANDLLNRIDKQLEQLIKTQKSAPAGESPQAAPAEYAVETGTPLAPQPEPVKEEAESDDTRTQFLRSEKAQAQKRNETTFLENTQRQRYVAESQRQQAHEAKLASTDRQRLQQQIKELRD